MTINSIPTKQPSARIVELDALRAIAAINLLLFHFTWVYVAKYGMESPLGFMFPYGKYGVQLFFMLSGFINVHTLIKKKPTGTDFVASRVIRIVPLFWLVVMINVTLLAKFPLLGQTVSAKSLAANLTMLPNLFSVDCMEPVTWTLMIEVLFYGFLCYLITTGRLYRPLLGTMMVVVVASVLGGSINQWVQVNYAETTLARTSGFVDQLLMFRWMPLFSIGILVNEIKIGRGARLKNLAGIVFSAAAFHVIDVKDHNVVVTGLLIGLLAMSVAGRLPVLRFKWLTFIGAISYPLYLVHNNAGTVMMYQLEQLGVYPPVSFTVTTAAVVGLSAFLTYRFERPMTSMLRSGWNWCKRRSAAGLSSVDMKLGHVR